MVDKRRADAQWRGFGGVVTASLRSRRVAKIFAVRPPIGGTAARLLKP
jgi:hypothetical protein